MMINSFFFFLLSIPLWLLFWKVSGSGICLCRRICECGKKKSFLKKAGSILKKVAPIALPLATPFLAPTLGGVSGIASKIGGLGGGLVGKLGGGILNNLLGRVGRDLGGENYRLQNYGNNLLGGNYGGDGGDLLSLLPSAFLGGNTAANDIYNMQKSAYESGAPLRQKALDLAKQNFGRTDFSAETPELLKQARNISLTGLKNPYVSSLRQIPELLQTASTQTAQRLANPLKSTYNPQTLNEYKTHSLADFDREFQRQQEAENEKLNLLGLNSSGPGFEQRRLTGEAGARSRALLGSQFEAQNMERARQAQMDEEAARQQALSNASALGTQQAEFGRQAGLDEESILRNRLAEAGGFGTQEFGINQLLGTQLPLALAQYGSSGPGFNAPPQDNSNAYLAYLLQNILGGAGNRLLGLF